MNIFSTRLHFKMKLIILFSSIVILGIFLTSLLIFYETSNVIREDTEVFNRKILEGVNLNIEKYFSQYDQLFFNIVSSSEFRNWLSSEKEKNLDSILACQKIYERYISSIEMIYPEIISIDILNGKGNEHTFYLRNDILYKNGYSLAHEPWFDEIGKDGKLHIASCLNYNYQNIHTKPEIFYSIRLTKKFSFSKDSIGYIQIDTSLDLIDKILQEMKYSNAGEGMILNESGIIMAHTDEARIATQYNLDLYLSEIKGKENGFFIDSGQKAVVVFDIIDGLGWKSLAVIPEKEVMRGSRRIWGISITVSSLSVLLSVLMIIVTSSSLTKRIRYMIQVIKQTHTGNFNILVHISGNDEISDLAQEYNAMLRYLERYISELAEAKMLQQETLISALQAQINSHFLYNTLEVINSMAYIRGEEEIAKATVSLSKMLRYTSNYVDLVVTIEEEVNFLREFLEIMHFQIGDSFKYTIDIENGLQDALCLKAIMQPIVENSLRHGFESTGKPGHIKISIGYYTGKYVCARIEDDGYGFSEEMLQKIQRQLADTEKDKLSEISKVGIINVNCRLKLFYRHDATTRLTVENICTRKGAKVTIIFPLQRKDEI